MGTDDIFKRRKENRKKRSQNNKETHKSKWILVCEGEKTEPNYFKNLEKFLNKSSKSSIKIEAIGTGRNTKSLVEKVEDFLSVADIEYDKKGIMSDKIVCIFDKDSFPDENFDNAIIMAEQRGYQTAWSNECYEMWLLLHFSLCLSDLNRKTIFDKLTKLFRANGILDKNQNYEDDGKSIPDLLYKINSIGGDLFKAISYAKKLEKAVCDKNYSKKRPCTTIYKIVEEMIEEAEYINPNT